jgi:CDGSH-type Zn-finger protein
MKEGCNPDQSKACIETSTDGPYVARNFAHLRNSQEQELPVETEMYLCRCGGSKSKPFCDGTHSSLGFDGRCTADLSRNYFKDYPGAKGLTIHDNRAVCSHISTCIQRSPEVFDTWRRPWVHPDDASIEETIRTIELCPSGSLKYTLRGVPQVQPDRAPTITLEHNGAYQVTGSPELTGSQVPYEPPEPEHFTLCRCGQSANKPYCDGRHKMWGFRDPKN